MIAGTVGITIPVKVERIELMFEDYETIL